jgi:hypothetical protein
MHSLMSAIGLRREQRNPGPAVDTATVTRLTPATVLHHITCADFHVYALHSP